MKKKEELAALCAEIVQRIKSEEDPIELNEYRSYVKKNVPFFMRSYFAAFLLKQLLGVAPRGGRKPQPERKRRPERDSSAAQVSAPAPRREEALRREEAPRRALPDDEAATLFVGVGRNRRAYARELLSFITSGAEIDADSVGELRVLDNFSFVQVKREVAESVIEKLNGAEFRGRSISVSFAKPRKEEAAPAAPEAEESESVSEE